MTAFAGEVIFLSTASAIGTGLFDRFERFRWHFLCTCPAVMERKLMRPDLLMIEARKHSEKGDWRACLRACQMALFCEPSGELFAGALYLKALALVELGRFEEAWQDITKVETLLTLYPDYTAHASKLKTELGRRKVI